MEKNNQRQLLLADLVQLRTKKRYAPQSSLPAMNEQIERKTARLNQQLKNKEEMYLDPRLRFTYPLHKAHSYRLGPCLSANRYGIEDLEEDGVSHALAQVWRNNFLIKPEKGETSPRRQAGDTIDVKVYDGASPKPAEGSNLRKLFDEFSALKNKRNTAKCLGRFLIGIDLFTSLFVYLEEAAEAHTDVAFLPYSGFVDDVEKAMEREDQYDPPFRTVTATEGKKEWKEQKDTVATLLEIVTEGARA